MALFCHASYWLEETPVHEIKKFVPCRLEFQKVVNRNRVRLRVKLMSPKPLYEIFNCKGA